MCIAMNFSQKTPKNHQTAIGRFLSKNVPKHLGNAYPKYFYLEMPNWIINAVFLSQFDTT